jgi:hypothetical protein
LLAWITREQGEAYPTNEFVLYDSPRTVAAYLSSPTGQLVVAGLGEVMFDDPFDLAVGFVPSTNAMTAHGLPAEKVNTFNLAENDGPTDGVSQTATAPPTSVLVTLAAAGRNPTDILIPTQAGTDGSGGDDDEDDAARGRSAYGDVTFTATEDGEDDKSHEVSSSVGGKILGALGAGLGAVGHFISPTADSIQASVMDDGRIGIFYINEGYFSDSPPEFIGYLDTEKMQVVRDGHRVALAAVVKQVGAWTTGDWATWMAENDASRESYELRNMMEDPTLESLNGPLDPTIRQKIATAQGLSEDLAYQAVYFYAMGMIAVGLSRAAAAARLADGEMAAPLLPEAAGAGTTRIPSVKGGEFARWFNELSVAEFEQAWANPAMRKAIEARLRSPGGMHEWLMVSRAPTFKAWGITAEQIAEMRTATSELMFQNPAGIHGLEGSGVAHNEILAIIDLSSDFATFRQRLQAWANERLVGGANALPAGLRP